MSVTSHEVLGQPGPPWVNYPLCNYNDKRVALYLCTGPSIQNVSMQPGTLNTSSSSYAGGSFFIPSQSILKFQYALDGEIVWQAFGTQFLAAGSLTVIEAFDDSLSGLGKGVHLPENNDWYKLYGLDSQGNPLSGPSKIKTVPKPHSGELFLAMAKILEACGRGPSNEQQSQYERECRCPNNH